MTDAEAILDVVNSPQSGWRLPTAGAYVHPAEVIGDILDKVPGFVVAEEIDSSVPVTILALSAHSAANQVGEMSFYSLRQSAAGGTGTSIEAAILYLSFLFSGLGLRKVSVQVRERDLAQFGNLPSPLVQPEGVLRHQLRVGDSFEDLHLFAIWREHWVPIEDAIGEFLSRRG